MTRPSPRGYSMHLYALTTILLWSLGYVLTRVAVRHFTPEAVAFLRYLTASVFLLLYALARRLPLPKPRDIPLFFLGGVSGFALYVYVLNLGSQTLSASVVSFIVSASPVLTALFARVLLRERIGLMGWCSVVCAFAGVGVITWFSGGLSIGSGALYICAAAVLISIYNIFQRKLLPRYSPLAITTWCILAGTVPLCVFAPESLPQLRGAAPEQLLSILVLGVFSAGIGYACWAVALSKAEKTSQVTNYMFLTPLVTTLLGVAMLGEVPHISVLPGGVLVLAGVVMINRRGRARPAVKGANEND